MAVLIFGLVVFFGIHLLPCSRVLRQRLINRLGEGGYKGLFSLGSAAGLGLIVWGMSSAPLVAVYDPPLWGRHVTFLFVLIAMVLLVAAYTPSHIRRRVGHPMLWGISFWAAGHLLANGDLASLLLFGSFFFYAQADRIFINRRQVEAKPFEPDWIFDAAAVVLGAVTYAGVLVMHPYLFGVPVLP